MPEGFENTPVEAPDSKWEKRPLRLCDFEPGKLRLAGRLTPEGIAAFQKDPDTFLERFRDTRILKERHLLFGVFEDGCLYTWEK